MGNLDLSKRLCFMASSIQGEAEVVSRLREISKSLEKENPTKRVILRGPFSKRTRRVLFENPYEVECEVENEFFIQNSEFVDLAMKITGADPEDRSLFDGTHHFITLELDFGTQDYNSYIKSIKLLEVDGIALENPDDNQAMNVALQNFFCENEENWCREFDNRNAEARDADILDFLLENQDDLDEYSW